jgi:hypothetical protein
MMNVLVKQCVAVVVVVVAGGVGVVVDKMEWLESIDNEDEND